MRADFKFVSRKRRTKEGRRFVTGLGRYIADLRVSNVAHLALVPSPYAAALIKSIDATEALSMPGVIGVVTGDELVRAVEPHMTGVDIPKVKRYPLAVKRARYAGEWVVAVVAETRALAEDAAEFVRVKYEPLPIVLDPEAALLPDSPLVHPDHGTNVLYRRKFVWGSVEEDFAQSPHKLSYKARWNRNSTVPIETFGVVSAWNPALEILDVWASVQMPKYPDQIAAALRLPGNSVRVHSDIDVGGSYGVKRGIKHAVLTGYIARKIGRPIRLIEDRLENMRGGDGHGPDRAFDVELAFDQDGIIKAMKMRAIDNAGAYTGRAPLQLGKPVGAIVGPYKIKSVSYEAISVTTNKTVQEAVRGFGQGPTNFAIETGVDRVARYLGLDRNEVRRRNFIRADEFPYLIPSGSLYDSGDFHGLQEKTLKLAGYQNLIGLRDQYRQEGKLAGIGIAACLEPSGGNSAFEPLFNPKNDTTTWMEGCRIRIDMAGAITVIIGTTSAGQGHETLSATIAGEAFGRDPDTIRVVRADSLSALPSNTPVGSRMAIMLGNAIVEAANKMKAKMIAIASHVFDLGEEQLIYDGSSIRVKAMPGRRLDWSELVKIAHRQFHRLPPGMEPGLETSAVVQVPLGQKLPTQDGRVQMYPCYSFEFHVILVSIDRGTGKPNIEKYFYGHDCGTQINPDIVRGMALGGIAHGIGVALLEHFAYDNQGQLLAQSFMDYIMPSTHEVPLVEMCEQETPSPHTAFGQKGSGEAGYLGAPAAIASAVNDALEPVGASLDNLPMRPCDLEKAIHQATSHKQVYT